MHFAKPLLGEEEADAARRAILSGWVTQGPEVKAFEGEFAAYVGASYACAASSCTAALHLALVGAGIGAQDEVITVSHSYIATANSIRYTGAKPVFVDIDPLTTNIDPNKIEAALSEKTKAILCVHQMGMPCDLKAIIRIAEKHNLIVIEDAACAAGSEADYGDGMEKIGAPRGHIACFSFHPRKVLTTGDGGMLTTADKNLDDRFRLLRQHGMSVPDLVRHNAKEIIFESYECMGFNYRMTDIQGAVGREQLKRAEGIIKKRRELADIYNNQIVGLKEIKPLSEPAWARTNWQTYCIRLIEPNRQREIMQTLLNQGIASRRGTMCAHRENAYPPTEYRISGNLNESELAQDSLIALPLHTYMSDSDVQMVVNELKNALRKQS